MKNRSSVCASPELVQDLTTALDDGQKQIATLLEERVFKKSSSLAAPIKKNRRKSFDTVQSGVGEKQSISTRQAHMEKKGIAALLEISEGTDSMVLETLFESRITDECLSLFNVDGSMRKTAKSKLLDFFDLKTVSQPSSEYIALVDMGLLFRLATPTPEDREIKRRNGIGYKWDDYLGKISSILEARHSHANFVVLVNDRYDLSFCIKDDEHDRRAAKCPKAHNQYPRPQERFPSASEFSGFMVNSANKSRL